MNNIELNQTPVRTAKKFEINSIKLKNVNIPENINDFFNVTIKKPESSKIIINDQIDDLCMPNRLGDILQEQLKKEYAKKIKIDTNNAKKETIEIDFKFDDDNVNLVDNIEIIVRKNTKTTIILKYIPSKDNEYYHNGTLSLFAEKDSNIDIVIVNLLNDASNNFVSINNKLDENSVVNYIIVDFGGKNSISNYYSDIVGDKASNCLNTIYLGNENKIIDMNYIAELKGSKSSINIDAQGALNDEAIKHFKGTIDFKKGAKKSKGDENEFCMLLSNKAKSISLPMLLCSEEDVEGNHSTAAGKVDNGELFYIMSRGFELKEAIKLIVRARFNKIISKIPSEELKKEIICEINRRLD